MSAVRSVVRLELGTVSARRLAVVMPLSAIMRLTLYSVGMVLFDGYAGMSFRLVLCVVLRSAGRLLVPFLLSTVWNGVRLHAVPKLLSSIQLGELVVVSSACMMLTLLMSSCYRL